MISGSGGGVDDNKDMQLKEMGGGANDRTAERRGEFKLTCEHMINLLCQDSFSCQRPLDQLHEDC